MDDLERLVAERDCARLSHRYCRFADLGQASRLAELFTQDGVFTLPARVLTGRAEIAATFARREAMTDLRTAHLCTNIDIEVRDRHTAHGWVYLSLHRRWREAGSTHPPAIAHPALVAVYEDEYSARTGTWLLRSRTQHVLFEDPDDPGWIRPATGH